MLCQSSLDGTVLTIHRTLSVWYAISQYFESFNNANNTPGEGPQMPMSPYKKESDMKALVSIRIADNVAEEEVCSWAL